MFLWAGIRRLSTVIEFSVQAAMTAWAKGVEHVDNLRGSVAGQQTPP